jgi:hypothetical protein
MVTLNAVKAHNVTLQSTLAPGLVAVFGTITSPTQTQILNN